MRKMILAGVVLGGTLAPGVALADTREDVVAGLTRCAALTDDRQWLDCYYGAAQPARASLGFRPALPDQVRLAQSPPAGSPVRPSVARSRVIASAAARRVATATGHDHFRHRPAGR